MILFWIATILLSLFIFVLLYTLYQGIHPGKNKIIEAFHMLNIACECGMAYGNIFSTGVRKSKQIACGISSFTSLISMICVFIEIKMDVVKRSPSIMKNGRPIGIWDFVKLYFRFSTAEDWIKVGAAIIQCIVRITDLILRFQWETSKWTQIDKYFSIYPLLLAIFSWTARIATKPKNQPSTLNCLMLGHIVRRKPIANWRSSSSTRPMPELLHVLDEKDVTYLHWDMWSMNLDVNSEDIQFHMWEIGEESSNIKLKWKMPTFDIILLQFDPYSPLDSEDSIVRKWKLFLEFHAPDIPRILVSRNISDDSNIIEKWEGGKFASGHLTCNLQSKEVVEDFLKNLWKIYVAIK